MATLLMFATAREASGTSAEKFDSPSLAQLLDLARERYGERFAHVLEGSRVWVNGEAPDHADVALAAGDEVAIIPPIAGG